MINGTAYILVGPAAYGNPRGKGGEMKIELKILEISPQGQMIRLRSVPLKVNIKIRQLQPRRFFQTARPGSYQKGRGPGINMPTQSQRKGGNAM